MRTKALRTGVWFASLSHEDRVLASLINRHIKIVKNTTLAVVIARIMGKLFYAMKHTSFLSKIAGIGRPIAQMYSEKAYSMGNMDALKWANDPNYIRYLGLMEYHSNSMNRLLVQNGVAQ
ncbi:MAG: hypothetical protein E6K88_08640 [Thaumarchaeota archaeon]|nr:MAG: hypothetical protein E6K88_08640 [Nitrososphaerota archaeon]